LAIGGDSNGSGTVALLEIARVFSHLYSSRSTLGTSVGAGKGISRSQNSLLFLLSGAGHFNYQGTQKFLEDQVDSTDHGDLQDTRLVVCLESLAANRNQIYVHLSRSIREGTMLHSFITVRYFELLAIFIVLIFDFTIYFHKLEFENHC